MVQKGHATARCDRAILRPRSKLCVGDADNQLPMPTGRRWGHAKAALGCSWLLALAACGGGGGTTVPVDPDPVLAAARLGAAGGTLVVSGGDHAGVALVVQPGAVSTPTDFAIRVERDSAVPSLFPVYRFEPADRDFAPGTVGITVRVAAPFFAANGTVSVPLTVFSRTADEASFVANQNVVLNEAARTISTVPLRLGRCFASTGDLFRVFSQPLTFVDPAVPTPFQSLAGVEVTVANGTEAAGLGRGSLAAFWSSPAAANLLVLHGLQGSPLDFRGQFDFAASLPAEVQNVVFVTYPSGRGVAATANALYDAIRKNQQPGFGCAILGHSLGGNIGRYLLEQSHRDASRQEFDVADAPLTDVVAKLFLLGVPNAGSDIAGSLFASLVPALAAADVVFVRAGVDLREGPDTFTAQQNLAYGDNAARYHTIAGDLGIGGDGIVTLASARAVPLFFGDTENVFPVGHFDLHRGAGGNGIAALVGALLQVP